MFFLVLSVCLFVSTKIIIHQLAGEYAALKLREQGRYLEAARMYEKAAEAEKVSPRLRMAVLADALNNAGGCYYFVGQYDKAIKKYEEALQIYRNLGNEACISRTLNGIGAVYYDMGQYDKTFKNYQEALDIARKLGKKVDVASYLNNNGNVYYSWGKYDKALENYEEALAIDRRLGRENSVATRLGNIGMVYNEWGKYDKALENYEEALAIDRRLGKESGVSIHLNSIGVNYYDSGEYDKAVKYYEEALAIAKKLNLEGRVAPYLCNIGEVYMSYGQYDKAIKKLEEALAIAKKLKQEDYVAGILRNIGEVYRSQGKNKTAIKYFTESVNIIEKLRKTATGDVRRDYLASQLDTYQALTSVYILDSDFSSAFQTVELSRSRLLSERLACDESGIKLPELKQVQDTLDEDTAILVYANVKNKYMVQIAITNEKITGKRISSDSFAQSSIGKYDKPLKALSRYQGGITVTRKEKKDNLLSDTAVAKSDFDNIINYYRSLLKSPSVQYQRGVGGITKDSEGGQRDNATEIGKGLYKLLIKPMGAQIEGKKNIIIVPDSILAFVPFESLIDEGGKYLVENKNISYVQSMGIREFISERKYSDDRKPLLAFGGAVYDEVAYNEDMVENETQLAYLARNVYADLENKRSVRNAYGSLGIGTWKNLPGTLSEIRNIKKVVKKSDIFTGKNVTEENIKEFSENGTLSKYKVLHFATHGLVVPEVPELSALVLSQFENEQGMEDGYLRMGEIAELDIKADFVNLSACETGLGKIYGGEGVVGLTQSFLLAGANAVSVSLWQVPDESTSQFMVSMYDRAQNQNISYSAAMTEVKRQFINGDFGEEYKAPYFWAPFVYYGKDDIRSN